MSINASPSSATPPPALPASRRELNKTATREAIANAALAFLRSGNLSSFTVDDVAAAAGVSRRTFFNYFSSVEAAIASFTQTYLDAIIMAFKDRPAGESILESAQVALSVAGNSQDLTVLAEVFALTQDPQLGRFQLQAWDDCSLKITELARRQLPEGTDELYIHALVGAVIGSCRAAFIVWYQRHGRDTSPAALSDLRELLSDTISLIRNGFAV
ncbi:TetR/AcrR family transcriptional regulator [Arthrobacter sp. N199823]|uniref:TetR/AcrR family transcriptional regulator n=1 Tax=unclassified Arthrobacter TaxID=235627 RepID=UPI0015E37E89|nr:TetR/AcrR family transcriptional regulator [Arthrobacter sp. N199823]